MGMMDLFLKEKMAPEFAGIIKWFNTNPLTMKKLAGKVVLIDFWTYTCINCIRTLPFVKRMHEKYVKNGLAVIGVHSPEFDIEKSPHNVQKAISEMGIKYPVALDSGMQTWAAFENQYWPAKYLINADGMIIYRHFGEGGEAETEQAIQGALGIEAPLESAPKRNYSFLMSHETYAGSSRSEGLGSSVVCEPKYAKGGKASDSKGANVRGGGSENAHGVRSTGAASADNEECNRHVDNGDHVRDTIYLDGYWRQREECVELLSGKGSGKFSFRFIAREVNMVIEPHEAQTAKVSIEIKGKKEESDLPLSDAKLYNVFKTGDYAEGELTITFPKPASVFALTFG
jgi:thiol-disulfide isomerase/thioredoxin